MIKKRAIVLVIDGLGVGNRGESSPNTLQSLLAQSPPDLRTYGTLEYIRQAADGTDGFDSAAIVTPSYEGADSYKGHYEMIGVDVGSRDVFLRECKDLLYQLYPEIEEILPEVFLVKGRYYISNNVEAELGTSINLIGDLDSLSKEELVAEGKMLSKALRCQRVIVMASKGVSKDRILDGVTPRVDERNSTTLYGIIPSKSGLYDENYFTYHVGRALDSYETPNLVDSILGEGRKAMFVGKVGEIFQIESPGVTNIGSVQSNEVYDVIADAMSGTDVDLIFGNFQQVDLMCHACNPKEAYKELIHVCELIDQLVLRMSPNDFMIITADHGNDPCKDNAHTREQVPCIIYNKPAKMKIESTYSSLGCVSDLVKQYLMEED